jgi:hypothetical protein
MRVISLVWLCWRSSVLGVLPPPPVVTLFQLPSSSRSHWRLPGALEKLPLVVRPRCASTRRFRPSWSKRYFSPSRHNCCCCQTNQDDIGTITVVADEAHSVLFILPSTPRDNIVGRE